MKTRILLVVMLLCAAFLFSTACNRNDDTPAATPAPAPGAATPAPAPAPGDATPAPAPGDAVAAAPTHDFGGVTIRISHPWGWPSERGVSADDDLMLDRIEEVERMLNVQIEMLPGPDGYWDIVVPSILAGEPFAEIKFSFPWQFINWYLAGAVKDITDLFDWNDPDLNQAITDIATFGGRNYGIGITTPNIETAVLFNKRLFEEAGLESPFDLVDQGRWDFATFREFARTLTVSTDGTGVVNQWGVASPYDDHLLASFAFAAGGQFVDMNVSPPRVTMDSPEVMDGLNLLNDMLHIDGSILISGQASDANISSFVNGQVAMLVGPQWVIGTINGQEMSDAFGLVPMAMGPRATSFVTPVLPFPWAIPITSNDELARATLHTFVEVFRPLHPELTLEETLTLQHMGMVHDERSLNFMNRLRMDWAVANPVGMAGLGEFQRAVFDGIVAQEGTPASIVTAGMEAAQIGVNERFGG